MRDLDLDDLSKSSQIGVLLASQRTRMAFHRTRMGADRTLMAIMRTALSMVAFGFTGFQFIEHLKEQGELTGLNASRNLAIALVLGGAVLQVLGIWKHIQFMLELRADRRELIKSNVLVGKGDSFQLSVTLVVATLMLVTGMIAVGVLLYQAGRG